MNHTPRNFRHSKKRGLDTKDFSKTIDFIAKGFKPLLDLAVQNKPLPFEQWLDAHLETSEFFCSPEFLCVGQDGEAAALLFSSLREQAGLIEPVTASDYFAILVQTMKGVAVRPAYGLHPRLMILGQLEARLVETDVMILSGLNEGTWPPDAGLDPWMSRPMRKRFGLPPLERSIGLSAHDFAQALCAKQVYLTRSLRVDGTPTVPSRWLQRMDTVLQSCGLETGVLQDGDLLKQARMLNDVEGTFPVERPAPTPPVSARPRQLPVTQIETWMNDPYGIYARHILKLKPLDQLEQPLDAKLRGTLIHAVLDQFVKTYPDDLPENTEMTFMTIARAELDALGIEPDIRSFWEPRLSKIANFLIDHETTWRQDMKNAAREIDGKITIDGPAGPFTLTARADRIDSTRDDKGAAIIDYKSGGSFTGKGMIDGRYPQLPLEAIILEDGGFEKIKPMQTIDLSYWIINGSGDGGTIKGIAAADKLTIAKDNAREGLSNLIATFDLESTPYYSLPRPERAPRFNDYEHLARVLEWTALDEQEDAA